jgi:hypothetical protein
MKKLILFTLLALAATFVLPTITHSNEAKAQIVTTLIPVAANDTLTNTDTAWVYVCTSATDSKTFSANRSIADNISRSVTMRVIKVSGSTIAGKIRFEGSNDGTNWELIDTAYTVTNSADQAYTLPMRATNGDLLFTYYRGVFYSSGTQVVIPKLYYVRRSN